MEARKIQVVMLGDGRDGRNGEGSRSTNTSSDHYHVFRGAHAGGGDDHHDLNYPSTSTITVSPATSPNLNRLYWRNDLPARSPRYAFITRHL